jgi:DNA repair protein RAD7
VAVRGSEYFAARQASGYASDELDEPAKEPVVTKKRKLTKAAEAKLKTKEKKNAKKKAEGDDDSDEDGDAYTALSKSMWTNGESSPSKPPIGSFEDCAKCEIEFTVVRAVVW